MSVRRTFLALSVTGGFFGFALFAGALSWVFFAAPMVAGSAPVVSVGERNEIDTCTFLSWVGKAADRAALEALGRPYRVLTANSVVTQDYLPHRINVIVDDQGIVTDVRCY